MALPITNCQLGTNIANLKALLHFNSNASPTLDETGFGNHGTLYNGIAYGANNGKFGGGFEWIGNTGAGAHWIAIPDTDALNVGSDGSFGIWGYAQSWIGASATYVVYFDSTWGEEKHGVRLLYDTDGWMTIWYGTGAATVQKITAYTVNLNEWHWFVITGDNAGVFKLYVDGVEEYTNNTGAVFNFDPATVFGIGGASGGTRAVFDGFLDDFFICDRVMSADEISYIYHRSPLATIL